MRTPKRVLEVLQQLDRHRRAARDAHAQRARPSPTRRPRRSRSCSQQRPVHRRHADTSTLTRSFAHRVAATAAGSKRGSSTSVLPLWMPAFIWQIWPNEWKSGSVISEMTGRSVVRPAGRRMSARADRVDHHVQVRQLGALGLAGRARRVEDHRRVVGRAWPRCRTSSAPPRMSGRERDRAVDRRRAPRIARHARSKCSHDGTSSNAALRHAPPSAAPAFPRSRSRPRRRCRAGGTRSRGA